MLSIRSAVEPDRLTTHGGFINSVDNALNDQALLNGLAEVVALPGVPHQKGAVLRAVRIILCNREHLRVDVRIAGAR